jgi:hypothetical protein
MLLLPVGWGETVLAIDIVDLVRKYKSYLKNVENLLDCRLSFRAPLTSCHRPSYFASKSSSGIATSDAVMAPGGKGKKSSASKGSKAPSKGKGKKSSSSSSSKGGKGTGDPTEPTPNNPPPTSKSPGKGGGKGESSPAPSVDINPKEPPTMGPDVPTMSPAPSGLITLPPICPDERECGRNPRPI